MKVIKLKQLEISNFKKVKNLVLEIGNGSLNIYGDNATGKTTLVDAFQWLLFDKNSDGSKNFSIKPLNPDGTEKHNLVSMVEATLIVDGVEIVLRKEYKEKWTKKRGEEEAEFSGHTTDYYVDETPKKASEYKETVDSLVDEETFKMLTNVLHFNSGIDWKARRQLILSLVPEVKNDDVIATDKALKELEAELSKKSVDDVIETHKNIVKKTNEDLKSLTEKELQDAILEKEKEQSALAIKIASGDNSQAIRELEIKTSGLGLDKRMLENFKTDKTEKLALIKEQGQELRAQVKDGERNIESHEQDIKNWEARIKLLLNQKETIYDLYDAEMEKVFKAEACSYCGQALPGEKVEELERHFNLHKTAELEKLKNQGLEINKQVEELNDKIKTAKEQLEILTHQKTIDEKALTEKLKEYAEVEKLEEVNPNLAKIAALDKQVDDLKSQIETLKSNKSSNAYYDLDQKLKDEAFYLASQLTKLHQKQANESRITELETEEKQSNKTLLASSKIISLCEKFQVAKINLLENNINDNFELVKFKMFESQINGGISETCIATVNGVPFADLNNGMKINAGLDIIKGLQKVKKIKAPIFIDNAESITSYLDLPDTQFIKLYVSENDKKLRFEEAK